MKKFPRPTIVVSKCLGFAPVRYNGQMLSDLLVEKLRGLAEMIPVCPEVEIGLGIPREPVRIVETDGRRRLIQPGTGRDVTDAMLAFSRSFLDGLPPVDGFILKGRSPSSGIKDVKIYPGLEKVASIGKGAGIFGGAVLDRFPLLAVEDEGRLSNFGLRETFLTRIFAHAALRKVLASGKMKELVRFQADHKLLLMAYSQKEMRALGPIVANPDKLPWEKVAALYLKHFEAAMAATPRRPAVINVLMHALGYFKDKLRPAEKSHFLALLDKYREGELPLMVVIELIRSWAMRYEQEYLLGQTFFAPFPEGLIGVRDSGKGVDL